MGRSRLRYSGTAALSAAVMMLVTGCAMVTGAAAPERVVIGVDLELTGDGAERGSVYRDALQLRVEQINDQGLIGDRELALEVRDNRSDAGTSAINVEELAARPEIAAVITGGCSACAVASAEVAAAQGVPMVALAAADQVAEPVADRRYVFKLAPNAGDNAAALAAQLSGDDVESIAVVAGADAYGEDGSREMAEAAQRADIEVPVSVTTSVDEESIQDAVDEVLAYQPSPPANDPALPGLGQQGPVDPGPDAVVVWAPNSVAGPFAVALREAEYERPLYLDSIAAHELFLSGAVGEALDGAVLLFGESLVIDTVVATSPAKAARKTWFDSYSARYGTYHAFSVFAVDALDLLADTVDQLDTTDRDAVRDGLERIQRAGVSGPLRLTPDNHSGLTSLGLQPLVARGDRWQAAG